MARRAAQKELRVKSIVGPDNVEGQAPPNRQEGGGDTVDADETAERLKDSQTGAEEGGLAQETLAHLSKKVGPPH